MSYELATRIPKDDGIPVLKGFITGQEFLAWCPFCRIWHRHCALDGELAHRRKSHRVAHCGPHSPFGKTGYYIRPFSKTELKKIMK